MPDTSPTRVFTLDVDQSGTPIVKCHGRLVSGVSNLLYVEVSRLIPGHKRIILDLTDLTHMDSMGIGTLVRLYVSARSAGCDLVLLNLGKQIQQLLIRTNLLGVFTIIGQENIKVG